MRFLSLIVLGVYIFSFNGVFADDFSDVKTRVNQIQNTNPALPGGGEQKGTIGTIISKLFNTSGKIKNEFLDVIDIATGKISNSYLDIFDATGDIKNDFLSFIDTSGNVKNENLSFIDNTTGNIKNENLSFYNTTNDTINAESLEGLDGLSGSDVNKIVKWGNGELSAADIYENGGKVGIGTSSPYTKFHVAESSVSDFSGIVSSNHTDSNYAGRIYLARSRGGISTPSPLKKDDAIGLLDFAGFKGDEYYGGSFIASVATQDFTTTSAPSKLEFVTTPKGSTNYAIRMTIDDDGDVGIGTITPSQKLDVDGNINFSGDLYKNGLPYQAPGKWQDGTSTGSVYYNSGKVGVGTNNPRAMLHVDTPPFYSGSLLSVGNKSSAIGSDSVAIGYGSIARGNKSFALQGGNAPGVYSYALQGGDAFGFGSHASQDGIASGMNSYAAQYGNASGVSSRATQWGKALGNYSFATQYGQATGYLSFATQNGRATSDYSVAMGQGTLTKRPYSTALGQFNVGLTNAIFEIGNGSGDSSRSNVFTILNNGNVGIGTISPNKELDISGDINFDGDLYQDGTLYTGGGKWQDGTNTGSVYYNSGNVGIGVNSPEQKLHLDGNLRVDNGSIAIDNDNNGSFGYITEASLGGIGLVAHVDRLDSPDLYVAGSGKVGIGTTNPSNKLTLVSIGDINGVNSGGGLLIQDFSGSTDGAKLRIDANEIQVSNNGSAGHFIMNAFGGDVGIGTVSPLSKLHVNGGIVSDYVIAQDNTRYKIISGGNGTSIGGNIVLYSAGHSTTEVRNDILFRSNAINVMKIDGATGNVGIGTISPGEKFQVNGTTRISGPAPTLQFSDTDHDNYMMHVNSDRMYFMHDDNNNFSYDDGDNSRMTLMNIGARVGLGIGTTTPTTELDVRGKTRITQGSTYDIWIQGGSASSGLGRNLAILGTDNDSGDKLYINYGGEYTNGTHFNGDIAMVNGSVGVGQAPRSDARFTVNGESWFSDEIRVVGGGRGTGAPGEISFEDAGGGFASIQGYPGQNGLIFIDSPKDDELHNISLYNNSNMFYRNGQFGIGIEPNAKLDVNGNIEYTGTISDVSDRRLKTNVKDMLDGGLVGILKMRPVSFTMKDDENQKLEYGFIAQEIEEILPELVTTADDDMRTKSLNYVGIIPHLVKAVQEQQEQINLLRQEIEDLRK